MKVKSALQLAISMIIDRFSKSESAGILGSQYQHHSPLFHDKAYHDTMVDDIPILIKSSQGSQMNISSLKRLMNCIVKDGWYQRGEDITGESSQSFTGWSVAISQDGNIVAMGSAGSDNYTGRVSVYIWNEKKNIWKQMGSDIIGEESFDQFGWSIDMSDDGMTLAIASIFNSNYKGYVQIYKYDTDGNAWVQLGQDIVGQSKGEESGSSISLSGDGSTIAIGSPGKDNSNGSNSGLVTIYKYKYSSKSWELKGQPLETFNSNLSGSGFGHAVSLSYNGNTLSVGAPFTDIYDMFDSGRVMIFSYMKSSDSWSKVGANIDGVEAGDNFGWSVSLSEDGMIVAMGAPFSDSNGSSSGQVHVYEFTESKWKQMGQSLYGMNSYDEFGRTVSISADGKTLAVGAPMNYNSNGGRGYVSIYKFDPISFSWEKNENIVGESKGDESGYAVALSATSLTTIIGSRWNANNGIDAGQARIFSYEEVPTSKPSSKPSFSPTSNPSLSPTSIPSAVPSKEPTKIPTSQPSRAPSSIPTGYPTVSNPPTGSPSRSASPTKEEDDKSSSFVRNVKNANTMILVGFVSFYFFVC